MDFIQTIYLARMRNNEHYQFMSDVANAINNATPAALQLDSVFPSFTDALARFKRHLAD